jgi:hypothetical protein
MEVDTSKRLRTLAVAEIPFDVRQNRCTKEVRIVPHLGKQSKKLWMPDVDQTMKIRPLWSESSVLFDWEEWPSMEPKPNYGDIGDRTMTHR